MKILIIEDERILANVLEEKFTQEDFEVKVAYSGEEAALTLKKFRPDIILLDLILPKKSGFDVLKDLKSNGDLKSVPVIILSNLGEAENLKKGLELGADDYMIKAQHPLKEVIEKVKRSLYYKASKTY